MPLDRRACGCALRCLGRALTALCMAHPGRHAAHHRMRQDLLRLNRFFVDKEEDSVIRLQVRAQQPPQRPQQPLSEQLGCMRHGTAPATGCCPCAGMQAISDRLAVASSSSELAALKAALVDFHGGL